METKQDPFSWQRAANCIGMPSSYFFLDEEGNHSKTAFKAVCGACPVQGECLNMGILYDFDGVWGGYTSSERRNLFKGYKVQLEEELKELEQYRKLPATAA